MNITKFDLNLLKVFAAVYAERNVSKAADVVGLSQPAMSNALQRMRQFCGDPLFVRVRGGMEPTALASELAGPVNLSLSQLESVLENRLGFDPARVERRFRVLTSDVGETVVLPKLMNRMFSIAPRISIEAAQMPHNLYHETLEDGRADLALGHLDFLGAGFYQQRLFEDTYCCIASTKHPQFRDCSGLAIASYVSAQHVTIASGNADAQVDRELARRRRRRSVALRVTHYHSAIEVVASSTLIATMPRKAVRNARGVRVLSLPFTLPPAQIRQFWHRRVHQDPGHQWLRTQLLALGLDET